MESDANREEYLAEDSLYETVLILLTTWSEQISPLRRARHPRADLS